MKSALLLKVLGFIMAGSILVGGGVLAGATLTPQREAANLIPTSVVGSPVEPNQNVPANDNMSMNTAVSPQPPATNTSGNQMGVMPDTMPPDQPENGMQSNGNMGMDDNWNNQMGAAPDAMPSDQPGYNMQGNGNMGMGGNWEMNGRDNWGMGGMNGNGNMRGNWGMDNGMNGQGTVSLAVTNPDEAAQAVQVYLTGLNNPDLILAEIVPYGEDYYAHIYQQTSGQYAFSLMVDACNGQVWPVNGGQ